MKKPFQTEHSYKQNLYSIAALIFALTIGIAGTGCGKDSSEETPESQNSGLTSGDSGSKTSATTTVPTGTTPTTTDPNSNTNSDPGTVSSCPQYPARSFYEYRKTGSGTGYVTTTYRAVQADQKLRVSVQPEQSPSSISYQRLAMTVTLLRDGSPIASKSIPTSVTNAQGYKQGLEVGRMSNPADLDFSPYLGGSSTYGSGPKYSIKISSVMTDYKCNTFCTTAYYSGSCGYPVEYCYGGYGYNPYKWNYDYHTWQWQCCADTLLDTCQKRHCGVGTLEGLSNAQWAVTVRVETDNTTCIPYRQ